MKYNLPPDLLGYVMELTSDYKQGKLNEETYHEIIKEIIEGVVANESE